MSKTHQYKSLELREAVYSIHSYFKTNGRLAIDIATPILKNLELQSFTFDFIIHQDVRSIPILMKVYDILNTKKIINDPEFKSRRYYLTTINGRHLIPASKYTSFMQATPYSFYIPEPLNEDNRNPLIYVPNATMKFAKWFTELYREYVNSKFPNKMILPVGLSIADPLIDDINNYSDETYLKHFNNLSTHLENVSETNKYACYGFLSYIYIWIQRHITPETALKNFKSFTVEVLSYPNLEARLSEGYVVVTHSLFTYPPKEDKVLMRFDEDSFIRSRRGVVAFDFTKFKNNTLRKQIKLLLWSETRENLSDVIKKYYNLSYLDDVITKWHGTNDCPTIEPIDIINLRNEIGSFSEVKTNSILSITRRLINQINEHNPIPNYNAIVQLLKNIDTKNKGVYTQYFTGEELNQIINYLKNQSKNETLSRRDQIAYYLYYSFITLMSITEIRKTNLLRLKADCLICTLSTSFKKEYKVRCKTKTSKGCPIDINITNTAARIIQNVNNITYQYREKSITNAKELLFIHESEVGVISPLSEREIDRMLRDVCRILNIQYKPFAAIRNYYQNSVSQFVNKNQLSEETLERLSGHSFEIHQQHYRHIDIKSAYERMNHITLGVLDLKGVTEVINKNETKENIVMNGCGNCNSSYCNLQGELDCLMCHNFVTTPSHIDAFKTEIKRIDNMIYNEPIEHEKEFLITKKKLYVAYLVKLIELKEGNNL